MEPLIGMCPFANQLSGSALDVRVSINGWLDAA
jgi:hypothetical protein